MKNNVMNNKTLTAVSMILLVASLVTVGIYYSHNKGLKSTVETEKIKSEALLSEKLQVQKSLEEMKTTILNLKGTNTELDARLNEKIKLLNEKESEMNRLWAENSSLKQFRQKASELEQMRDKLSLELAALKQEMDKLNSDNDLMANELAQTKAEIESLTNEKAMLTAFLGNNYRMEAMKGKREKMTLNGRKTNKIEVSFDLPPTIKEDLHFKVITPSGDEISSLDNKVDLEINDSPAMLASMNNLDGKLSVKNRIFMTYKPTVKLTSGIYQFDIYSKDTYVGSAQLRLK